jgi:hypothetical protein
MDTGQDSWYGKTALHTACKEELLISPGASRKMQNRERKKLS